METLAGLVRNSEAVYRYAAGGVRVAPDERQLPGPLRQKLLVRIIASHQPSEGDPDLAGKAKLSKELLIESSLAGRGGNLAGIDGGATRVCSHKQRYAIIREWN